MMIKVGKKIMSIRNLPSDSAEDGEKTKKTKTDTGYTTTDTANPSPSTNVITNLFHYTNIAVTLSVASTSSASSEQAGNGQYSSLTYSGFYVVVLIEIEIIKLKLSFIKNWESDLHWEQKPFNDFF